MTQGYKVDDIENVVLTQTNGVPVLMKDVGKGEGGLRAAARHSGPGQPDDDVVGAIVVMSRTEQTANMIPKVKAAIDKTEPRRQPAAGRQSGSFL